MTRRVIDLDQLRIETSQEPIEVVVGGRTFELPPSLPVSLALQVGTLASDRLDAEAADAVFRSFMAGLVGDRAEELASLLTLDELQHVCIQAYGVDVGESSASAGSSPNGGTKPRPTSLGSTARS